MVSYNTQIDNKNKKYKIQFETDNFDTFKWIEKVCRDAVEKNTVVSLKGFPTYKLVQELVSREGIETEIIEPHEKALFKAVRQQIEAEQSLLSDKKGYDGLTDWG